MEATQDPSAARVRVAVVQPRAWYGEEEWRNAEAAVRYLEEALRGRPDLVCFPEGYPGPCHGPSLDAGDRPVRELARLARRHGVHVSCGNLEPNPDLPGTFFLTHKLIGPDGRILANYRRVQPDEPLLNAYLMGGRHHVVPGDRLCVVDSEVGRLGLLICSELYVPELARIEMLLGAHIILAPVNGGHTPRPFDGTDTWNVIARARAAENLVFVIQTQNMFMDGVRGCAVVASPEGVVARSEAPGVFHAELDLARLLKLRRQSFDEEVLGPPQPGQVPFRCRPGQHRLRRPDLYRPLVEPQPEAFDYFYWRRGLDAWAGEQARVREGDAALAAVVEHLAGRRGEGAGADRRGGDAGPAAR